MPNSIPIFIQARMNSSRLPGKVLTPICGKPLLAWLLDSLRHCQACGELVLLTSAEETDLPLADFAAEQDLTCIRGPLDDVAGRFAFAADQLGCEAFVRICGDSPLMDHRLVDRAVTMFTGTQPDLVTNVLHRSYPKGQSVEVVGVQAFTRARQIMTTALHREHVTSVFYEQNSIFHIEEFVAQEDWQTMQLSVDTAEDFNRAETLLSVLELPLEKYTWLERARLMRQIMKEETC